MGEKLKLLAKSLKRQKSENSTTQKSVSVLSTRTINFLPPLTLLLSWWWFFFSVVQLILYSKHILRQHSHQFLYKKYIFSLLSSNTKSRYFIVFRFVTTKLIARDILGESRSSSDYSRFLLEIVADIFPIIYFVAKHISSAYIRDTRVVWRFSLRSLFSHISSALDNAESGLFECICDIFVVFFRKIFVSCF